MLEADIQRAKLTQHSRRALQAQALEQFNGELDRARCVLAGLEQEAANIATALQIARQQVAAAQEKVTHLEDELSL